MTKKIIKQYKFDYTGAEYYEERGLNIIQIGIQGPSGIRIHFNDSENPIYLGPLGIYQLELTDGSTITSFKISDLTPGKFVIVDTIQEIPVNQGGGG